MDTRPSERTHRAQRRRPTVAKEWQLAVLKKLQSESGNPTEEQRSAAAAETGLDEKWVRNWFTRQRSKLAAQNRKSQLAGHSTTGPTFKLQHYQPPSRSMRSQRSVSTPIDPAPCLPSPASLESSSPPPTANTQGTPCSQQSISTPSNNLDQNLTLVSHTTTIPTYSRDPLCNRYPDFSQFFRPRVHEQFHIFELSSSIGNGNHPVQLVANLNMVSHTPMHFQGPLHHLCYFGGFSIDQSSLANVQPYPVAFSMRLVDLLGYSPLA